MNYSGAAAAAFRPQFRPNRIITSSTPQKNKKWSETTTAAAVTVVVGTTIALAGAFLPRPSLALPGSRSVGCSEQKVGYEGLLDSDPRDPVALKMAFYGEMKGGRMGEAAKYAERLREVEPEEVEWRLLQALSCELVGDLGKAKMVYGEILEEMPLFIRALHRAYLSYFCRSPKLELRTNPNSTVSASSLVVTQRKADGRAKHSL